MPSKSDSRPSAADVARRAVILKYVVGYALTAPPRDFFTKAFAKWDVDEQMGFVLTAEAKRDKFWNSIYAFGLKDFFLPDELELTETTILTMTAQQQIRASWHIEALQVLMWSLGLIDQLPAYDEMAGHDLLRNVPRADAAPSFIESATLRDSSEIDQARGLAELWHWRSRTRQIIERGEKLTPDAKMLRAGIQCFDDIVRFTAQKASKDKAIPPCLEDDFPAKGKAYRELSDKEWSEIRSITMERHFALNWLCGYAPENRWDKTPTDT